MAAQQKNFINYYDILGVPEHSTQDQIKKAYYNLQKHYHPDVSDAPDATEKSQQINEAFEVVGRRRGESEDDYLKRRGRYNEDLKKWKEANPEPVEEVVVTYRETAPINAPKLPQGVYTPQQPPHAPHLPAGVAAALPSEGGGQGIGGIAETAAGSAISNKVAGSLAGKVLAGVVGSALPVIGNILIAAFGDLLAKGTSKLVKEAAKNIARAPVLLASGISSIASSFTIALATMVGTVFSMTVAGLAFIAVLTTIILFIINSGGYIVPPSTGSSGEFTPGGSFPIPPGGVVSNCPETGEITSQMASRITNGSVRLLPDYLSVRSEYRYCIEPTMIIMHWSGGTNNNPNGNDATYNTLINRNLACQLGTDTNNVEFWQPFYENTVEMSWCAGYWNNFSVNNEMAGISFTANPPPPNLAELEMAYDATCEIMEQYDIPWCQIYGHYEVPFNGGKTDPGEAFLNNVFIPEIRRRCANDVGSSCPGAPPEPVPPVDPGPGNGPF